MPKDAFMKELLSLNQYFARYKFRVLGGICFVIAANFFRVYNPTVVGEAIDAVSSKLSLIALKQDAAQSSLTEELFVLLARFFLIYLSVALAEGFFTFFMRQSIIVVSRLIEFDLKNKIYSHYQKLDLAFYRRNATGDLMNRITEDVSRVRMYLGPAIMYTVNLFFTTTFAIVTMWQINSEMTTYVLLPLPILSILIYVINRKIDKSSEAIQARLSDLTSQAQEVYSGIRVVQSYSRESAMTDHFTEESNAYRKASLKLARLEAIYFPVMNFLIGCSLVLTVWLGGMQAGMGKVTTGNIAEFILYVNMLMWPVSSLGWVASMVQRAIASMRRINRFLDEEPSVQNKGSVELQLRGDIEFRNVSFTYPHTGIKALKDFSIQIKAGEKVAIIGRTGSGKSTIADLLLRMYDPQQGELLLDGVSIKNYDVSSVRSQIGFVPQDVFLFSETVAVNIAFGLDNKSRDEIEEAARAASVHDEIMKFPQAYDTIVGERGVMLSGGQKQRISIARALIRRPALLILDDSLSAVDAETEKKIQQSLEHAFAGRTALIITHRIFSLIHFDKIIVLDDGQIAESGTHESLMQQAGLYSEIYELQQMEHRVQAVS